MLALRDVIADTLLELASQHYPIVAIDCDVGNHTRLAKFAMRFPTQSIQAGVSEQHAIGLAAGMAHGGAIPVVASYAAFITARCYEQIRHSVSMPRLPVLVIGTHAGFAGAEDGASHQCFDDLALMSGLPGMRVFSPADAQECADMLRFAVMEPAPTYFRVGRAPLPPIPAHTMFRPGQPMVLAPLAGPLTLVSTGEATQRCLVALTMVSRQAALPPVGLVHIGSVQPIDTNQLVVLLSGSKYMLAVEDHWQQGGIGALLAKLVATAALPGRLVHMCMPASFGQSGTEEELTRHYELDASSIASHIERICLVGDAPATARAWTTEIRSRLADSRRGNG